MKKSVLIGIIFLLSVSLVSAGLFNNLLGLVTGVGTCTDSDSLDTKIRGTVSWTTTGGTSTKTDSCATSDSVAEWRCTSENIGRPLQIICNAGYSCVNGACVATKQPTPSSTETNPASAEPTTVSSTCGNGICEGSESCEWNGLTTSQKTCNGEAIPTGKTCSNCVLTTTATCGNNICETGEATICPTCTTQPCPQMPCTLGTCPTDCPQTPPPSQYFFNIHDVVTFSGKQITLTNVGNSGQIIVMVDGTTETINPHQVECVNGISIANHETFYEDNSNDRSATLFINTCTGQYPTNAYFFKINTILTLYENTLTLQNVGSTGQVVVSVNGFTKTLMPLQKECVNGLALTDYETGYKDQLDQRTATLLVESCPTQIPPPTGNRPCADSDNGLNYRVHGVTVSQTDVKKDTCVSSADLDEYSCDGANIIKTTVTCSSFDPTFVCVNDRNGGGFCGVPIDPNTYTCLDKDGVDPLVKSQIAWLGDNGTIKYKTDSCHSDGHSLAEWYCPNHMMLGRPRTVYCADNYLCVKGACVKQETTSTTTPAM